MSTLWHKDLPLDAVIHRFTVGDDPTTDLRLVPHDCVASAAHARTLTAAGLLSAVDARALLGALQDARADAFAGRFVITTAQEDCHTALEQWLTAQVGEAGKRIHLGRSRNDQVLVAQRLLLRGSLVRLTHGVRAVALALLGFAEAHRDVQLPGYTHLRRALPSSFGQWAGGYAQGLCEELEAARGVFTRLDRCPLGAGPGFGVPLPLDRELTAKLLGFSRVQVNPIDCIDSRGRDAVAVLDWLVSVCGQLERLHWDLALYSTEEFGFVRLPDEFTTGSSAMPQKRNPDVVELARARCRQIRALRDQVLALASGLPSSYHRDLQLTKQPMIEALEIGIALLDVSATLVARLEPNAARAAAACTPELWATHAAYQRAAAGVPFRDAYKEIAAELKAGSFVKPGSKPSGVALGAPERLELAACHRELETLSHEWRDIGIRIAAVETAVFDMASL